MDFLSQEKSKNMMYIRVFQRKTPPNLIICFVTMVRESKKVTLVIGEWTTTFTIQGVSARHKLMRQGWGPINWLKKIILKDF